MAQDVFYRVLDHRSVVPESGAGKTVDISSGGVLFETERRLRSGQRVELSVNWPAQLEGSYPLNFVALGRVVRVEDTRAAMHIEQYEFRTWRMEERPTVVLEEAGLRLVPYDSRIGITRTGAAHRPGAWPPLRAV
jgi:PilZ domain-containing protein